MRSQGGKVSSQSSRVSNTNIAANEALLTACKEGNTAEVQRLLASGADVNTRNKNGHTPLMHVAFGTGNTDIAQMLLAKGADIDAKDNAGETALIEAAWAGQPELLRLLIDKGANIHVKDNAGETALHEASYDNALRLSRPRQSIVDGKVAAARILIERGVDVNAKRDDGKTALDLASSSSDLTEVAQLLTAKGAVTGTVMAQAEVERKRSTLDSATREQLDAKLLDAVKDCKNDEVQRLLDSGADANAKDAYGRNILLWRAADKGCMKTVSLLVKGGAKVDDKVRGILSEELVSAVKRGNRESVRTLLDAGANPNSVFGDGVTVLAYSVGGDLPTIAGLLLQAGADPNARSAFKNIWPGLYESYYKLGSSDWTPLMYAVAIDGNISGQQRFDLVKSLLARGADVNARNSAGNTALALLGGTGGGGDRWCEEMGKILLDNGANINAKNNDGWTPLMIRAIYSSENFYGGVCDYTESMIERGADLNTRTNDGWTLLMLAAHRGNTKLVKRLLEKGVDIGSKATAGEFKGFSALDLAQLEGNREIVKELQSVGVASSDDLVSAKRQRDAEEQARIRDERAKAACSRAATKWCRSLWMSTRPPPAREGSPRSSSLAARR